MQLTPSTIRFPRYPGVLGSLDLSLFRRGPLQVLPVSVPTGHPSFTHPRLLHLPPTSQWSSVHVETPRNRLVPQVSPPTSLWTLDLPQNRLKYYFLEHSTFLFFFTSFPPVPASNSQPGEDPRLSFSPSLLSVHTHVPHPIL